MARTTEGKRLRAAASDIWASTVASDTDHVAAANFSMPSQSDGWDTTHSIGETDLMRIVWNRLFYWLSSGVVEINTIGIPEYSNAADYKRGAIVNVEGDLVRAIQANGPNEGGVRATTVTAYWEAFDDEPSATAEVDRVILTELAKVRPFAIDGDRHLPNDSEFASSTRLTRNVGYPESYSEAAGGTPRRTVLNQLICEITAQIHELTTRGVLEFDSQITYQRYAIVQRNRKLWSRNTAGGGAWLATDWTEVIGVINPPAAPVASGQITRGIQYQVSWTEPNDGRATITGYRLQRATNAAFTRDIVNTSTNANTRTANTGNLTVGLTYYWRVQAINAEGNGAWSNVLNQTITSTVPQAAPTNLRLSRAGVSTRVRFNAVAAADNGGATITGYRIYWRSGSETTYVVSRSMFTQSLDTLLTLTPGVEVTIVVAAVNENGEGPRTGERSFTPSGSPDAPRQPRNVVNGTSITTTWIAPTANGNAITSYGIDLATDEDFTNIVRQATTTSAVTTTFTNLARGRVYYTRVSATNRIGTSDYSPAASATIPAIQPGQVVGVAGSTSGTQIVVTYRTPAANGAAITGFTIQISTSNTFASDVTTVNKEADELSHTFTGLTRGTTYYYRVSASNSVGAGQYSATGSTQVGALPPDQVTGFSMTASGTQIATSWSEPANNGAAISNYQVEIATNSTFSMGLQSAQSSSRSHTFTGLTRGQTYYGRVRATNTGGDGPYSAVANATVPATAPARMAAPTLRSSGTSITASYSAPDARGSAITQYSIQLATNTGFTQGLSTATKASDELSHTFTGLVKGETYYVRVAARNGVNLGTYSPRSNTTIATTKPDQVGTVSLTATGTQIVATWAAPGTGGSAITGYAVELATNTAFTRGVQSATSTSRSHTFTGLTRGQTYYVRVAATNTNGTGTYSGTASATIPAAAPSQVTGFSLTPSGRSAVASWTAPSDNGNAITGYSVQIATNNGFTAGVVTASKNANQLSHTFSGLTRGVTYRGRVRAINQIGNGTYSATDTATIPAAEPGKVGGLMLTATGTQIAASWSEPAANGASISQYTVQISTSNTFASGVTTATSTNRSHTFTNLLPGQTYYVRVAATNSAGTGSNSDTASASIPVDFRISRSSTYSPFVNAAQFVFDPNIGLSTTNIRYSGSLPAGLGLFVYQENFGGEEELFEITTSNQEVNIDAPNNNQYTMYITRTTSGSTTSALGTTGTFTLYSQGTAYNTYSWLITA